MNMKAPDGTAAGTPETVSGLMISLLFWLSLLVAVSLFALVGLSPKLLEQDRLRDEHASTQLRLVQIEQQNEQLERVVEAIGQDKDFAAELTRIEFDAVGRNEEIIPVESQLRLSPPDLVIPRNSIQGPRAWFRPLLTPFVDNDTLRFRLLMASAVLVVISFTWFQPSSARKLDRPVVACWSIWNWVRARYVRSG